MNWTLVGGMARRVIVTDTFADTLSLFVPFTVMALPPTSSRMPEIVQSAAALIVPAPPVSVFVQFNCPITLVLQAPWTS